MEARTSQVHNRFKLWSKSLRKKRVLPPTGHEHNCCSRGKLHFSLDRALFRLLLDWRPERDVVRGEERMQEERRIPRRDRVSGGARCPPGLDLGGGRTCAGCGGSSTVSKSVVLDRLDRRLPRWDLGLGSVRQTPQLLQVGRERTRRLFTVAASNFQPGTTLCGIKP